MADSFTYLVVEGIHDAQFLLKLLMLDDFKLISQKDEVDAFWQPTIPTTYPHKGDLLKRMPVPFFAIKGDASVSIQYTEGITNIPSTIEITLVALEAESRKPTAIGFILDADTKEEPSKRYETLVAELTRQLDRFGVTFSSQPGSVAASTTIRTGGYIIPDNLHFGTLEDILLACADIEYAEIAKEARRYVAAVENAWTNQGDLRELKKPAGKSKAVVSSIASILKPGKAIQVSLQDNRWLSPRTLKESRIAALQQFLRDLIQY